LLDRLALPFGEPLRQLLWRLRVLLRGASAWTLRGRRLGASGFQGLPSGLQQLRARAPETIHRAVPTLPRSDRGEDGGDCPPTGWLPRREEPPAHQVIEPPLIGVHPCRGQRRGGGDDGV